MDVKQLDLLIEEIEKKPLSEIVPRVLLVALECKDFRGYCVLSFFIRPIAENQQTNAIQKKEVMRTLLINNVPEKDVISIVNESIDEYIELKTVSADEVSSHSIKELEIWLDEAKHIIEEPMGVSSEHYKMLANKIMLVRRLYETLRGYVINKLTYYSQVCIMQNGKNMPKASNSVYIENQYNVGSINGEKININQGENNSINIPDNKKKESKFKQWMESIVQNLVANWIWWLLGVLIGSGGLYYIISQIFHIFMQ